MLDLRSIQNEKDRHDLQMMNCSLFVEVWKNHDTMMQRIEMFMVSGKERASMRDYDNMTDQEFIKAYETPYTDEERDENHETALRQYAEGKVQEFTDELIDDVFADEAV